MEVNFNLNEIKAVAEKLLASLNQSTVIAFHGEMGAGKTTFIHSLCELMKVKDNISSPTYSIINQYTTNAGKTIWHLDLYRLRDEEEAINAGVEDCLYGGDICLVEWPEKAPDIFPDNTLQVYISVVENNSRKISW